MQINRHFEVKIKKDQPKTQAPIVEAATQVDLETVEILGRSVVVSVITVYAAKQIIDVTAKILLAKYAP